MQMKRKVILISLLFSFIFCTLNIEANSKNYMNNNGIEISEKENERLQSLGFTENEIMFLSKEEYDANKNLYGEVVAYSEEQIKLEKAYYKSMNTIIIKLSNGNFRYKVNLVWSQMPKIRSYDVIGIGIENNVNIIGNINSSLLYSKSGNQYLVNSTYNKISNSGVYSIFKLPEWEVNEMNISLHFDVKTTGGSSITAYGDYSHAIKNISLTNAKRAQVNESGIFLPNDILNYYDNISVVKATRNI